MLVHVNIRESLLAKLVMRVKAVKIGNSLCEEMEAYKGPVMGPVVSKGQYDKVWKYIDDAREEGLTFLYGGDRAMIPAQSEAANVATGNGKTPHGDGSNGSDGSSNGSKEGERSCSGFYIPPTILVDVPTDSRIWNEEVFGPVLCIREFSSEEEAIYVANDSMYGLAAAVISKDTQRCERIARSLRAGIVWENCSQPAFIQAPWGGVKRSGFGRELGRWGLEEFTCVKQVTSCSSGYSWELW